MIIVWGSRHYGRVDSAPGVFHIATQFGHIYYIPLIPERSLLKLDATNDMAIKLPLNWKSVFVAWGRAFLIVIALFALIAGVLMTTEIKPDVMGILIAFGIASCGIAAVVASYFVPGVGRATETRAMKLAQAHLNEIGMIRVGVALKKITPEEGERMIKSILEAKASGGQASVTQHEWTRPHVGV